MGEVNFNSGLQRAPDGMGENDLIASNIAYIADRTGRKPEEIDYETEREVFFGKNHNDKSAYYETQKAQTGFLSDWSKNAWDVIQGDFEPQYTDSFWNNWGQSIGDPDVLNVANVKAKTTLTTLVDILPSFARGGKQFAEQVDEAIPKTKEVESLSSLITGEKKEKKTAYGKVRDVFEEISENPFIQTMMDTPLRFIDESGRLNKEAKEELRKVSEEQGGKTMVAVSEIGSAVEETITYLAAMRLAGVKIGQTPAQSSNASMATQVGSRLATAGKLAAFKYAFSEANSLEERADIGAITAMYMATPAVSGFGHTAKSVFAADLMLNSAITAPQINDLWERDDLDEFDKVLESVKMVGSDVVFSSMTKTMRGNKLSPSWAPMVKESQKLIEVQKKVKRGQAKVKELDDAIANLNEKNVAFADPKNKPKQGNQLNRIQGESDTANKNGEGYIKVEQSKADAEKDILELERKLIESLSKTDKEPAKEIEVDKVATEPQKGIQEQGRKDILETIEETKQLPIDARVDAVNRALQNASDGKPKADTRDLQKIINLDTGVTRKKRSVIVDEYQMLKKQLRDVNQGVKEGKKLGKAEAAERKARLADIHNSAKEYIRDVVHDREARNALAVKIPNIKTVEGLDKFQREVNYQIAKQATNTARKEAQSALKELKKTKLGGEFKTAADDLIADINTSVGNKKLDKLREIKNFLESNGIEITPETAEKLSVLEKTQLKDMGIEELNSLRDVAKSIIHMQKQREKMTKQGQIKIVEEKATEYVDEQRPDRKAESGLLDKEGNRLGEKSGGLIGVKRTLDLTPNALLFYLDGGREGAAHDLYVKNIWKADDQRLRIEQEAHRYMEPVSDAIEGWDRATAKDGYKAILGGENVTISKAEKIAIYLDSLNKGNMKHVLEGGYEIDGKIIKPTISEIEKISYSVRDEAQELDVASRIYNGYQNILKNAINETSNKVNGYDLANVDNYHPISTVKGVVGDKEVTPTTMADYGKVLVDSSPHLKKRTGGRQAIRLNDAISKYDQMVKMVARYNAYAEPIMLQKQFLDGKSSDGRSIRKVMTDAYGKTYVKALEQLTKDLEAGGNRDVSDGMKMFNKGVMHVGRGYLALNVGVAAGQPVSYLTAGNVIPVKHWSKGKFFDRNIPWDVMGEHSSLLWSRGKGHLDIAFGESAEAKKLSKNMGMIRAMDHKAISQIWKACESWVKEDKGSVDPKEVAKRVDDVVRRTQPTFEAIDRPALARDPNFRFATMFSSVINKNHALKFMNDVEAYEKMKRGDFDNKSKTEWMRKSMLNRVFTPAVFAAIKTATNIGFLSDLFADDENTFLKRFGNKFADASIGEMGIIASKLGQLIKYAVSKKASSVSGNKSEVAGKGELEEIFTDLFSLAEFALRADEDLMNIKSEKQRKKEKEADERMIKRLIRGSLALGGKGYQNVFDIINLGSDIATKEDETGF